MSPRWRGRWGHLSEKLQHPAQRIPRHEGGGAALLAGIKAELAARPYAAQAVVLAYECLGACTPRGRVSIAAEGRWGVVFGGLDERREAKLEQNVNE